MPLKKIQFNPGINSEVTAYSNEGGWRDCDKIRFRFGYPEKLGGWSKYTNNTYLGTVRALHNWVALDGSDYLGLGSHIKYYIEEGSNLNDITPIRKTTTAGSVSFTASDGSNIVKVTNASHGAAQNDFVTFASADGLGPNITAALLNKEHQITRVIDADNYEITLTVNANTTGVRETSLSGTSAGAASYTGKTQTSTSGSGTGAEFSVTAGASTYSSVTVTNIGTGYAVNDTITISGTDLGGTSPANDLTITIDSLDGDILDGATTEIATLSITSQVNQVSDPGPSTSLDPSDPDDKSAANPAESSNPVKAVSVSSGTSTGTATFTGVTGTANSGNGTGATFTISSDGSGGYTVDAVTAGGDGYSRLNTITILGSDLGGVDTTNDLVLDIDEVELHTFDATVSSGLSGTTSFTANFTQSTVSVSTTQVSAGPPVLRQYTHTYSFAVNSVSAGGTGYRLGDTFTVSTRLGEGGGLGSNKSFKVNSLVNSTTAEYQINVGLDVTVGGTGWGAGLYYGVTNSALQTTLNEGSTLSSTDATITLTSTTGISAGDVILIDSELILVGGVSSNDLTTCTRGHSGTTASTHTDGSIVRLAVGNADPADDFSGWGDPASGGLTTTSQIRLWSHDNFGEDLLLNPRDDQIYYWDKTNNLSSRAVKLNTLSGTKTSVPTVCKQVLVSDRDRHVIAFGADGLNSSSTAVDGNGTQDPLLIRFSDQENATEWYPTATNTAGDLRLGSGSEFVQAVETKREILIWTDTALTSMRFIGPPFTFGLQQLASNITIMSPNAATATEDFVFWMGIDNFYVYAGQTAQLPCTVKDHVFLDFNLEQKDKVVSGVNSEFGEVFWFYSSAQATDNDRYVVYNYQDKLWYYGSLERTAWLDRGTRDFPIAVGGSYIYNHEFGYDDDGSAMTSFIESGAIDLDDGDRFVSISKIIPDLTFKGSTALSSPQATFTIKSRNNPGADFSNTSSGTTTRTQTAPVEKFTEQLHVRTRGRSFAMRIESNSLGSKWKLGSPRLDLRPDGRR